MMTPIMVALFVLALALLIQRLALLGTGARLRVTEQAFRFHAIRDEVEELLLEGALSPSDEVARFLRWTANMGIKNAGSMKLRDALATAREVDLQLPDHGSGDFHAFVESIKQKPAPVQRLVARTFIALAEMLVSNDRIAKAGLYTARATERAWKLVQPILEAARSVADAIAPRVVPDQAEAVRYAREYSEVAEDLAPGLC